MRLYLISQDRNNGYDTWDDAVVCAESKEAAQMTYPSGYRDDWDGKEPHPYEGWTDAVNVKVREIGWAHPDTEVGVVCASFNAG